MERAGSYGTALASTVALLIAFALCPTVHAQQASPAGSKNQTQGTGSVAGRVTIAGKPAAGVTITLSRDVSDPSEVVELVLGGGAHRTTTGPDGTYRFSDLVAGEYTVDPHAPA
ncbi:MAG TPA: carboxypeptidase-like regulatory domain-containing protein, partial [Blastocatellia bacterium]|nr:carboxypeptidase-like regulatory domain-containing protein [Blastocatellia bacterium]